VIGLFGPGLIGIALLAVWLYCIFDVIATEEALARNLPKIVWLLLVIFVPTIGAIAWLALGRPLYAGWRPGDTTPRPPRPPRVAPEDRPDWNPDGFAQREAELRRREEELKQRDEELRRRDADPDPDAG